MRHGATETLAFERFDRGGAEILPVPESVEQLGDRKATLPCRELARRRLALVRADLALPWLYGADGWRAALHMTVTGAVGVLVYKLIKTRAVRERPYITHSAISCVSAPLDRYSFPSGHTLHAVSFTLLIASYFPEWTALFAGAAFLIALSRVVSGLHYPTDVAAGAVLGGALGLGSVLLGPQWFV